MKTAFDATPNISWWCQASGTSSPSGTASCIFMVATGTAPLRIQRASQGTSLTSRRGWRWKKRPVTFPSLASCAPWMSWAWVAPKKKLQSLFQLQKHTNFCVLLSLKHKNCVTRLKKVNYSRSSERHKTLCLIQEGSFEFAWLAVQPAVTLAGNRAYGFKTFQSLIQRGSYSPCWHLWLLTYYCLWSRFWCAPVQSHPLCINISLPEMSQNL